MKFLRELFGEFITSPWQTTSVKMGPSSLRRFSIGEFSLVHWIVVFAILLIFLGPKKLPEIGQSLGKAIRDFKKSMEDIQQDTRSQVPYLKDGDRTQKGQDAPSPSASSRENSSKKEQI